MFLEAVRKTAFSSLQLNVETPKMMYFLSYYSHSFLDSIIFPSNIIMKALQQEL